MRYSHLIAVTLAADLAAAHALPFSNLDSAAARSDYVQIEAERAQGADEQTLQKRHPSAFGARSADVQQSKRSVENSNFLSRILEKVGLNDVQVAQAKAVIHQESQENTLKSEETVSKRSVAASNFLTRLLEKTGMNDVQIVQAKDVIADASQENGEAKTSTEPAVAVLKRSSDSFVTHLLESIGLNDLQTAQAKNAIHKERQANEEAHSSATISKRSNLDGFLAGLLDTIGLSGAEKEQVQSAVEQKLHHTTTNEEVKRTDDVDEQTRQQIEAMAKMDLVQDATRPVPVADQLVRELKAWRAAPGTKRAYEELAARHEAVDKALGKRHALCV